MTSTFNVSKYQCSREGLPALGPFALRAPNARDGARVADLVRRCPPLDPNSLYCNLLQCTHFADTCALALADGKRAVGWLSAYRLPADPETLFVWQVAVAEEARGAGLAHHLIDHVLARDVCARVEFVQASVAPTNVPSLRMFQSFAARRGAVFARVNWLDRHAHFEGRHESEPLIRIGPIRSAHRTRRERA